ncbi:MULTISPECIES: AlpA family phage regulatory protein [unclassified Pseudomonas]|uniref:AlpA family phage regulatory protein n=1 Tax=unclassified Pseudomonas TaxID=196821 RepID=UPI0015A05CFE|nr:MULTISPECIES: AlpA family transcriptional regulator [unclassified Pseudomonas]NWC91059.1 AlpA family transcriptional regulator [Pseudomonas sp. IPO3779]NWD16538.1 AlpA family transcriptional regulator [Pseudomonas sp. IPO3778]
MDHENTSTPALRVLRLKHVMDRVGLSRSTIYDRLNEHSPRHDRTFPRPVSLGGAAVGWLEADISDWIKSKLNKTDS